MSYLQKQKQDVMKRLAQMKEKETRQLSKIAMVVTMK